MIFSHPSFLAAIADTLVNFKRNHRLVYPGQWQGVDVSDKSEMATYELLHHSFCVEHIVEGLLHKDVKPNLPWADDHFAERVSGLPINPGEAWKNWPWGLNAEKFLDDTPIEIDERDWAYLAGMIDGDGAITFHRRNSPDSTYRPRISISQKDHNFIKYLGERFPFGQTTYRVRKTRVPDGRKYDSNPAIWYMTRKSEVKWVLGHIIPYLYLKKEKAIRALTLLNQRPEHYADGGFRFTEKKFNHNYQERYWPRFAAGASIPRRGIRYEYGDLGSVVDLLLRDPNTRQAYLPIFFSEDTGGRNGRAPCSLGYHFIMRQNELDITYSIRSCDLLRHFRDDIYLTARLLLWVLEECKKVDETKSPEDRIWNMVKPGKFIMNITSLHCFMNDWIQLFETPHQ